MIKPKIMFNKFYKTILYLLLLMTEVSAQGLLWQYAIRSEGCDLIDSSLNPECQQFELYALKYDSKVCLVAKNKKGEVHEKDDLIEGEYEDKDNDNDKKL